MTDKLTLFIEPKPQTRPRFTRYGRTYEDSDMKKWRRKVTGMIQRQYTGKCYHDAVKVEVVFYMKAPQTVAKHPTPKSHAKTFERYDAYLNEKVYHNKRPDLDNLVKAVFDSMSDSGIIWIDDNQVCDLHAKKLYSPTPRIEIIIKEA